MKVFNNIIKSSTSDGATINIAPEVRDFNLTIKNLSALCCVLSYSAGGVVNCNINTDLPIYAGQAFIVFKTGGPNQTFNFSINGVSSEVTSSTNSFVLLINKYLNEYNLSVVGL